MPKRTDIHKILIIGSGPIIISQACEFDYSGTQACKALREEGYEVILVNSNPATIMTDPEMADRTYIEPLTVECLEQIIAQERPDALLPTLGGQTGLNLSVALAERGVLEQHGVALIGASIEAIQKAEDRELFQRTMASVGLEMPQSRYVRTLDEARAAMTAIRLPCVIRPSFTLGGTGGGVAATQEEFETIVARALEMSMIHETSVEESVVGWKEFELEVMRDRQDNVVIVCSIENLDPMGIHTGDSITVAPAQTLTDREYQAMRDASIKIIRAIGVETGGSNIQFAVHPDTGRMLVIEMNPRVSRSSALASKATGFPIAKIAAKLAVGYTLDELPNDITRQTPACFEPSIDYVVVKVPRFAFEKFPEADPTLTTQMKSVGETMAIGRTFKEALQKALRGLEIGVAGLEDDRCSEDTAVWRDRLARPNAERIFYLQRALRQRWSLEEIFRLTRIDRWFLRQMAEVIELEGRLRGRKLSDVEPHLLLQAKQHGFSDQQLAKWWGAAELEVRARRKQLGLVPQYYLVDTCAAEFEAVTPYYYSTYEGVGTEAIRHQPSAISAKKKKVMILGGGPNRIGQGIEFDYCCVHASFALKDLGYETIMVNSNPETVSTDYDTSDRLYFEPVTLEDVLNIYEREQPEGVIIQLGGQTPLNLAMGLERAGVKILGTPPGEIDRAEDREKFNGLIETLGLRQPEGGTAVDVAGALAAAHRIGYPCLVRPSYVLGGRAMEIVYDDEQLTTYMRRAIAASPEHPILIDRFLEPAIEVDVDAIGDGAAVVIGGILEHVEQAGVHSGDAAMVLPPHTLPAAVLEQIRRETQELGRALRVVGLMNVQYAVKDGVVYILEVNPRASRTVPFVSKAIGVPLAKLAAQVMVGKSLRELGCTKELVPAHIAVKESVLPFARFSGVDIILGPEMKSTGEVMGIDLDFGRAFIKSQLAAGQVLPRQGAVFVSVTDRDKPAIVAVARGLVELGFTLVATGGTHHALSAQGIPATRIGKIQDGHPNPLDLVQEGRVQLIINTPTGKQPRSDEARIRAAAIARGMPCITTIPGALASVEGIRALISEQLTMQPIQVYHQRLGGVAASATGTRHE